MVNFDEKLDGGRRKWMVQDDSQILLQSIRKY